MIRMRAGDDTPKVARARLRYQQAKMLLSVLTALVLLLALVVLLWQGVTIRDNQRRLEQLIRAQTEQAEDVATLLEQQKSIDARQEQRLADGIAKIAAEQRRALVVHDRNTLAALRSNGNLVRQELYGPANQENRPPAVIIRPPAPRPAPSCQVRGKRCR